MVRQRNDLFYNKQRQTEIINTPFPVLLRWERMEISGGRLNC